MQNKLQELTDKLYEEGLSKGKEEGAKIVENALKEAERILAEARQNAGQIREEAEKSAAEMKSKVESDLKMASAQTLQATRQEPVERGRWRAGERKKGTPVLPHPCIPTRAFCRVGE